MKDGEASSRLLRTVMMIIVMLIKIAVVIAVEESTSQARTTCNTVKTVTDT